MTQENTVSNSGKGRDYKFSRVYLLLFSKGQLTPRDIDLNNTSISSRAVCTFAMDASNMTSPCRDGLN